MRSHAKYGYIVGKQNNWLEIEYSEFRFMWIYNTNSFPYKHSTCNFKLMKGVCVKKTQLICLQVWTIQNDLDNKEISEMNIIRWSWEFLKFFKLKFIYILKMHSQSYIVHMYDFVSLVINTLEITLIITQTSQRY